MQYLLGVSEMERSRLQIQGRLLEPFTRRVLRDAGLREGMRVLDVGTGTGDVALLAAEFVGPSGSVLGVDCEPGMVEHARLRAEANNVPQVAFQVDDLSSDEPWGEFDFLVARLVTPFQADPLGFVRKAASLVKPGGTLTLIEPAWNVSGAWSNPPIPAYDSLIQQMTDIFLKLGADPLLGSRCIQRFHQAGLPEPSLAAELLVGGPASEALDFNVLIYQTAAIQARKAGLPIPDASEIQSLHEEIRQIAQAEYTQFNGPCISIIAAWSKVPPGA